MLTIPYDPTRDALYSPQLRATVFAAGGAYSIPALSVEFARLAYVHGEDGGPELARLGEALALVGFEAPTLFGGAQTDTHGFGALRPADGLVILAFRGTEPEELTDIATDLDASMTPWSESAGNVHEGFARAARSVLPSVTTWLQTTQGGRTGLVLTGHSLGAAIATLVASVCRPNDLITIGCPRLGDADFAATLGEVEVTRFVDCCDLVTELPPELGGYVHVGPMTYITSEGLLSPAADEAAVQADRASARIAYLRDYAWRTGNVMLRDLADHAPINYVRSLFP